MIPWKRSPNFLHRVSVAPMMACTDRHYRVLARLISKNTLLYTEMVTANAIVHGDQQRLLGFSECEHPIALQVGGSDPNALMQSAQVAQAFGYDEINLNVGCPSDRVQKGKIGACLMLEPELVADCVQAMRSVVDIPVTVKTRIGVDEHDSYDALTHFVKQIQQAGCETLIVHARKAWLKGLSPRENRNVPLLQYDVVHQLKKDFPDMEVVINGGIKTLEDIRTQLTHVDGVMIGREAYSNPFLLASIEREIFGSANMTTCKDIVLQYVPYVASQLQQGKKLRSMTRHLVGLFQGQPGARQWRRTLSEQGGDDVAGVGVIEKALLKVS